MAACLHAACDRRCRAKRATRRRRRAGRAGGGGPAGWLETSSFAESVYRISKALVCRRKPSRRGRNWLTTRHIRQTDQKRPCIYVVFTVEKDLCFGGFTACEGRPERKAEPLDAAGARTNIPSCRCGRNSSTRDGRAGATTFPSRSEPGSLDGNVRSLAGSVRDVRC